MIRYLRLLALGMVALGASACSMPMTNGEDQALSPTDRYPITVEPQVATMAVAIDDGMQRLAPGEADRIRAFAERWKARGQGMINAAAPSGSANRTAAMNGMDEVKRILRASGIAANAAAEPVIVRRLVRRVNMPLSMQVASTKVEPGKCKAATPNRINEFV